MPADEAETTAAADSERKPIPQSLWRAMDGQPVMIQLREGLRCVTVTHPNEPVVQIAALKHDAEGKPVDVETTMPLPASQAAQMAMQTHQQQEVGLQNGTLKPEDKREIVTEPLTTPYLRGRLTVLEDKDGTMLMVEFRDPLDQTPGDERPRSTMKVILPPDYVGFMSSGQQNLIR